MPKHYHVMAGVPGYMPDVNDVCPTRASADESMRFHRDDMEECWFYDHEGKRTSWRKEGSIKAGFIYYSDPDSMGAARYVERVACNDFQCLEDLDE